MGDRRRESVSLLLLALDALLLANVLSEGRLWRASSDAWAAFLERRRHEAELRRQASYVIFEAWDATREASP